VRRFPALLLAAQVLCGVTIARAQDFPRVAVYGGNRSWGVPLIERPDGPADTVLLRRMGSGKEAVTVGIAPWWSPGGAMRADVIPMLAATRPGLKVFPYHLVTHWYLAPTFVPQASDRGFPAAWHRAISATQGWLAGAPPGYEVDWARRATADTLASLLCGAVRGMRARGIFLDYLAPAARFEGISTPARDSAVMANMRRLVARLREAGGPGFVIVGNGIGADQLQVDGTMREGFPNDAPELGASFDAVRAWQGGGSSRTHDWLQSGSGTKAPYAPDACQAARFALGTGCLWGTLVSFGPDRDLDVTPFYGTWFYDEFSVTPYPDARADTTGAHAGWLGKPAGPARRLGSGAWMRRFARGAVLVNPTSSPVTVQLGEGWRRIRGVRDRATNDGSSVRSPTLAARDALFLVSKTGTSR